MLLLNRNGRPTSAEGNGSFPLISSVLKRSKVDLRFTIGSHPPSREWRRLGNVFQRLFHLHTHDGWPHARAHTNIFHIHSEKVHLNDCENKQSKSVATLHHGRGTTVGCCGKWCLVASKRERELVFIYQWDVSIHLLDGRLPLRCSHRCVRCSILPLMGYGRFREIIYKKGGCLSEKRDTDS